MMHGPSEGSRVPLVYVLTLNWNGKQLLDECLSAILALDYPNFRVVVIDNGSTDGSVEFIGEQFPQVHVIENGRNLGYPAGFNIGLSYGYACGADFFLVVNNDTVIDPGALRALVAIAQSQDGAGFVSGKVYFYDRPSTLQTVGKGEDPVFWSGPDIGEGEEEHGQYATVAERPFLDDIFILIPRRLYEEIGGYDPQLFLQCEGFDWQIRAKKKGWRSYFAPEAKLWHHSGYSMEGRGSPISEYFFFRNHLIVMAKHGGLRRYIQLWCHIGYGRTVSVLRAVVGTIILREKSRAALRSRIAGWLGWLSATLWLLHRRPATGIPWLIRWLSHKR